MAGANAVVLGRSDTVGSPVAVMLRSRDATVKTVTLVVAAIGKAEFVKDATKNSGQRLVGDVDFASASAVASFITPVANTLASTERIRA
ncbi:hypothetical protein EW145_g1494 [Phellinidium pouzarii]|uniref:methenyltetrahydrofolate cyclohydrolase n=1 Tax=Phellinidium pouzarii TaxID=167371 RepID=A0A4S4LEA9_9AGAM|nr:hypothetical protein EW145_g1494 [Phellinidium pouzarii]